MIVWGVDTSTKRIAIWAAPVDCWVLSEFPAKLRGSERLAYIHLAVTRAALGLADVAAPTYVLVEKPTGKYSNPALMEAYGVSKAALHEALSALPGNELPVPVAEVAVSAWKRETVGRGGATKDDVLAWARTHGYAGDSQDVADARGIAYAALQSIR